MNQRSARIMARYFGSDTSDSATAPLYFPEAALPFDLSLTESALGPSPAVDACRSPLHRLASYPADTHARFCGALAKSQGVGLEHIALGAGIDDLLQGLASMLLQPLDVVVQPACTFPKFAYYANQRQVRVQRSQMAPDLGVDFARLYAAVSPETRIVYLCNPNNPTGKAERPLDIVELAENVDCLVVVDEANVEFCHGATCVPHVRNVPNLIVLRTFSKAYGLAGARVGYAVGPAQLIVAFRAARPRFPVPEASMVMAMAALEDQRHIAETVRFTRVQGEWLQSALRARGFKVHVSDTNCFVASVPERVRSARTLRDELNGMGASFVLGDSFGLTAGYFRVAPQRRETNESFIATIDIALGN